MAKMEKCMNMLTMFVSNFKLSIKYTETFLLSFKKMCILAISHLFGGQICSENLVAFTIVWQYFW